MCLMRLNRRETGVSCAVVIVDDEKVNIRVADQSEVELHQLFRPYNYVFATRIPHPQGAFPAFTPSRFWYP